MGKRSEFEKIPRDFSGENNNCFRHGHNARGKRSPEYKTWVGVRARINNPLCKIYPYYGGRGITYDPRWEDFLEFLTDVGSRPSLQHTLDRVDPNGPYTKDNVRWATRAEQSRNKRCNILVEGVVLKDWCNARNYNYKTVWRWLTKEGNSVEEVTKKGDALWGSVATTH